MMEVYPTWYSRIGWTVVLKTIDTYIGTHGIPMDSPTYPTRYSGIGRTVGSIKDSRLVHMGFQWTVPPILHGTVG